LAAGTIGQVHRATLASDKHVVVKVQRRDARAVIEQDLALLEMGIGAVGSNEVVKRRIDLSAVFEHLATSLQQELDFRREAANAERLRASLAGFSRLAVPAIHERYSTSRLLVMQDVAGGSLEDVPSALRQETARQFLESRPSAPRSRCC
jgi:ubiquinone biosynthesis protein